jgi:hypothetical protein
VFQSPGVRRQPPTVSRPEDRARTGPSFAHSEAAPKPQSRQAGSTPDKSYRTRGFGPISFVRWRRNQELDVEIRLLVSQGPRFND